MCVCALLTGRRAVWSPRCPLSSLQVGVGGAEEEAKAGSAFPQGGRLQPEALLLERLKIPTVHVKEKSKVKKRKQNMWRGEKLARYER